MCLAAGGYVDYLLQKVHNSHMEERRRLGRELHDRAAPAVLVGLQSLDLHDVYRPDSPGRAEAKLSAARRALTEALQVIRQLSAESRETVGRDGLPRALERYLAASAPRRVRTTFTAAGDFASLPSGYAEELFLVLREAARNALMHANPSSLAVQLDVSQVSLYGRVQDDGDGFDVEATLQEQPGIGLMSMRERLDLLGGTLTLRSMPRAGTIVEVAVPLPGALR
jgi:signal transduction histidine kinase